MGKCICSRTCFIHGKGLIVAGLTDADKRPLQYDIDPCLSYAIHFTFLDLNEEKIRKANELFQEKRNLERSIRVLVDPKEIEKTKSLLVANQNKLKDIPNEFKD